MLIRFVVSNFLSFNEECEFNMLAGSFKTHKHHVYPLGKVDVLKAAEIYGANGAGKSNFIQAIESLKELIVRGSFDGSSENAIFKLNKKNATLPTSLEIEFSIEKRIYSFGISILNNLIIEEWLYESGINVGDKFIFERKISKSGNPSIKMAQKYQKSQKSKLLIELMEENFLKNNELLLSKAENLKISEILKVKNWFANNLVVMFPNTVYGNFVMSLTTSNQFKTFVNDILSTLDTGVKELEIQTIDFDKFFGKANETIDAEIIEDINNGNSYIFKLENGEQVLITKEQNKIKVKRVVSLHENNEGSNTAFEMYEESDGTQRLLDFIPAFDLILHSDSTIVVDEIDQSLHPALLKALIQKIMADTTTKGQLIFTTHESNLLDLDIFRQDEIWFAEKDKKGSTHLYSLSDFKPRYDLDIRKGYLKGRFGAIPFLGNLKELNWSEHA